MKYQDLIGRKFNSLTVLEFLEYRPVNKQGKKGAWFKFQCDCGNICEKRMSAVKSGTTKTCGDLKHRRKTEPLENLSDIQYGRITVCSFVGLEWRNSRTIENWLCDCRCGNTTVLTRNKIITQSVKSCGCLLEESRGSNPPSLSYGSAAFNDYFSRYVDSARKKDLDFLLNKEEFEQLIYQSCIYCGSLPNRPHPKKEDRCNGQIFVNGIDRVDNSKGYTVDNCVTCCDICNKAKRNLDMEEFVNWIIKIQQHDFPNKRKNGVINTLES